MNVDSACLLEARQRRQLAVRVMTARRAGRGQGEGRGGQRPRMAASVLCGTLALGLAGCGAPAEEQEAGSAALRFVSRAAVDPGVACSDLAPRTVQELERSASQPCPQALEEEGLSASASIRQTAIAGNSALVHLADPAQTVFLARFDSGWKIVAAGCRKDSTDDAVPYTCLISGG